MTDGPQPASAAMAIAASALKAQQARMRIIAENIANADSVATTPAATPIVARRPYSRRRRWGPA
jgi:flagellar basal-body rod protein FlgC